MRRGACFFTVMLPLGAIAQSFTRAEAETFLSKASVTANRQLYPGTTRITLDDGTRKHDATVQNLDPDNAPQGEVYGLNIAAYELDKMLELNLVVPSVERIVDGKPAVVTWWVDDRAMSEQDRRKGKIEPPDPDLWNKQMQAVRVFDELISNTYRNINPDFYTTSLWDNLLITPEWKIRLIDHKAAFRITRELEHPESLTQCDRTVLGKLRQMNKDALRQKLGKYLTPEQLDGLEARRGLLVRYFDELIAARGPGAVLYDLPPRQ